MSISWKKSLLKIIIFLACYIKLKIIYSNVFIKPNVITIFLWLLKTYETNLRKNSFHEVIVAEIRACVTLLPYI